jgi:hypothetical protein
MPRKTFTAGEILASADVNTFLMDQSVMTFADSAARGSAIPSPTEGMVTYLEDSKNVEVFDGTNFSSISSSPSGNAIINGAFEINQRNFTTDTSGGFCFDRFRTDVVGDGTSTRSAETFTPGQAPVAGYEGTSFFRVITAGQTSANARTSFQALIESVRTFAGQTVTFSFFAKAGSGTPKVAIEWSQQFGAGGSAGVIATSAPQFTLSTAWQRFSVSFAFPSIAGKTIGTNNPQLQLNMFFSAGSDLNARTGSLGIQSNTFDIWGLQLEAGSTATDFRRNANSLAGELAACQRYYYRIMPKSGGNLRISNGFYETSTNFLGVIPFPVTMRRAPDSVDFANITTYDSTGFKAVSAIALVGQIPDSGGINLTVSGATQHRTGVITTADNVNAHIGFSAEL